MQHKYRCATHSHILVIELAAYPTFTLSSGRHHYAKGPISTVLNETTL